MNENEKLNDTAEPAVTDNEVAIKRNKKIDLFVKIGCVLVAFFIWLYVMAVDSPTHEQEFVGVPIEIVNNSGLSVLQGKETAVNITVMGKRSLISKLTVEDLNAYIDLDKKNNGSPGKYNCPIQFSLPGGVSLVSSSLSAVSIYLDNTTVMSVPIEVVITDYMLEDGYELRKSDIVITDIEELSLTGPATELEKIHHAQMDVAIGHVTKSVTVSGELYLVDADGEPVNNTYIKMQQSYATAYIPVFKSRTIQLNHTFKYGYFNSGNTSVVFNPQTITVKGEIDDVDAFEWIHEIDEKQVAPNGTYTVPLKLPEGIYSADELESVTYTLKTTGIADAVRTVKIDVNNPNKFSYEITPKYIDVYIRGESSYISKITANDVTAEIDLSSLTSASGFMNLPVNVTFSDGYTGHVFETGTKPTSVTVRLS